MSWFHGEVSPLRPTTLCISTQPLIFTPIICRNLLQFNANRTLNSGRSWQGRAGSDGQTPSHQHHFLRKPGKERDRWALSPQGNEAWLRHTIAFPKHWYLSATIPWRGDAGGGGLWEEAAAPHRCVTPAAPGRAQPEPLPQHAAGSHRGESWLCRCFPGQPDLREVISRCVLLNTLIS